MYAPELSVGVLQVVDTLEPGGAESVAVNLANHLPRDRYRAHLCTTRRDGPLARQVAPDVRRLALNRRGRFDLAAVARLAAYIREQRIGIVHAHSTSAFLAAVAAPLADGARVLWHDHYGRQDEHTRPATLYGPLCHSVDGVISVNRALAQWTRDTLRAGARRVWYVPNFVPAGAPQSPAAPLPGPRGFRIVHVANFRPQKDHLTLVRAMARVRSAFPRAHALLVGAPVDPACRDRVEDEIRGAGLETCISILGPRLDVPAILAECDIGVLSSAGEGLPLALLEYGMAGLPCVCTRVGQCAEVLDDGRAGMLVPPRDPDALAAALAALLAAPAERRRLGRRFKQFVERRFSLRQAIERICAIYDQVLQC